MNQYEILIIGAGPGGYEAAIHAGKLGKKVAVVDCREAGGTCLNRGCIPTKTLLHSSELYHEIQNGAAIGVTAETVRADLPAMFARKNEVTAKLRAGIEALFKSAKVDFLRGKGQIVGPNTVTVTNDEGVQTYTVDAIIAATGSVPARPPIPGLDLEGVMTSDELLEGTDRLLDSLTIIGGGVIGVEFATFFTDLGCKVNVVEGLDRLLPNMDKELGQNLAMILKKRGALEVTRDAALRAHLCEEMADVFMYLNDVLLCCGVTAEEFASAYHEKMERNLQRDFPKEHQAYLKSEGN